MCNSLPKYPKATERGFALVVTITLLVLLSLLAIGLLSLSSVTLRNAAADSAHNQAKANARLALMIAIGELQKELGPDQRISANGAILSPNPVPNPHWTGAWDSWVAGPLSSAPINDAYPSVESHHSTLGNQPDASMRPDYDNKAKHFRRWLLSLNPSEAREWNAPLTLALNGKPMPAKDETAIRLVGEGSLGKKASDADFVSARLIDIKSTSTGSAFRGRYAWWVGDESQKARVLNDSYYGETLTSAEKIFRSQAPGSTGTKTIAGLSEITPAQEERLEGLPSLNTLDVVPGVQNVTENGNTFRASQRNFHHTTPYSSQVLADVREGGLKRDLSTLLEQPIRVEDSGVEYMLYEFDDPRFPDRAHSRVPIQDLAAYYQLHDHDPNWTNNRRGGVMYDSSQISNSIQTATPDYGTSASKEKFLRQYTGLYLNPVPIKVQFLMGFTAERITDAERTWINNKYATDPSKQMRAEDTHKLRLVVMPVVTLWNPSSLPVVMGGDTNKAQVFRLNTPPFAFRWRKYLSGGQVFTNGYFNLNHAQGEGTGDGRAARLYPYVIQFRLARPAPVIFEPGEVKMFSVSASVDGYTPGIIEPLNAWDPFGFYTMPNSALESPPNSYVYTNPTYQRWIVFNSGDKIDMEFHNESISNSGRNVSPMNETYGGGFNFYMMDNNYEPYSASNSQNHLRNYQFMSRFGGGTNLGQGPNAEFNAELMTQGFPGKTAPIDFDGDTNAIPGSTLIGAGEAGEVVAFAEFSIMAGCEIGSQATGGFGSGRRIATRPFLHGSTIAPPFINQSDTASLYDFGWDWQINRINNVEDSLVEEDPGTGNGYYGGGYNSESGTTQVIQQEIPVLPALSIAALSHAHLSGYSLANDATVAEKSDSLYWKNPPIRSPQRDGFQRVTATGQGGLAPRTMQAIGNSYAHPNIPSNKSHTTMERIFRNNGTPDLMNVPYVDHSYLANKALWDDFFFSSITPKLSKIKLYGTSDRTSQQVAGDFFFEHKFLPNRRIRPYTAQLDEEKLGELFAEKDVYTGGLADKIAAHLMVQGPFNINSTSVEAWRVLLTSLKGKPVSHLKGADTEETTHSGTPISPGMLPNAKPVTSGEITSPNNPPEQWKGGRELTDDEINQLAIAIVKQVRERGPFLSLSEFINRKLDGTNLGHAAKGALQAALDDSSVSINASFRTGGRTLDGETNGIPFVFPEAAKGPIAYGSTAYVDQADILRHLAEQLTPRGDTFIIRTYGDSLDASGNVVARAWCEAVVQRIPEYVDGADENHVKAADMQSVSNKMFGRKFQIISFRWLDSAEV